MVRREAPVEIRYTRVGTLRRTIRLSVRTLRKFISIATSWNNNVPSAVTKLMITILLYHAKLLEDSLAVSQMALDSPLHSYIPVASSKTNCIIYCVMTFYLWVLAYSVQVSATVYALLLYFSNHWWTVRNSVNQQTIKFCFPRNSHVFFYLWVLACGVSISMTVFALLLHCSNHRRWAAKFYVRLSS